MKYLSLALMAFTSLSVSTIQAGPLYDPFLEQFQVGALNDPAAMPLSEGFPTGLLDPALVDTVWTRAALSCLDPGSAPLPGCDLARQLLATRDDNGGTLLSDAWQAVQAFNDPNLPWRADHAVGAQAVLDAEWGPRQFFKAWAAGDRAGASAIATGLAQRAGPGFDAREAFIWSLRARRLAGPEGRGGPAKETIWPEVLGLGPYDAGNAWALWVAHRRSRHLPVLAVPELTEPWSAFLGGLGQSRLNLADFTAAALPDDWYAGLGAVLLPKADLETHFRRYPAPPEASALHGNWVEGRRKSRLGEASFYEELAARRELKPGWRLDLWRRASELRLLAGEWERGLSDLQRALDFSREGQGTKGQRRRLRQWVEQAMVLAIAQGRSETAVRVHGLGLRGFSDVEKSAFLQETQHWHARLGLEPEAPAGAPDRLLRQAATAVESGRARPIEAAHDAGRAAFLRAADRPLWEPWARWGLALIDTAEGGEHEREVRRRYVRHLAGVAAAHDQLAVAITAVAPHLPDDRLVGQALDADIARLTRGATPPRPSLVPALARLHADDRLALHALLGFALAAGDMRGIIATATLLPAKGLTEADHRLFLYPLPSAGPVRDALLGAGSEPSLVLAVARNESLFEPAVRSRAGALGWMQIMPFHFSGRGAEAGNGHWSNPAVSIAKGDGLLAGNSRRYGGDPYRTLAAYNAGPEATDRWDRQLGGGAAPEIYLAWIGYPETRHYVEKVLIDRFVYDAIIGGTASE